MIRDLHARWPDRKKHRSKTKQKALAKRLRKAEKQKHKENMEESDLQQSFNAKDSRELLKASKRRQKEKSSSDTDEATSEENNMLKIRCGQPNPSKTQKDDNDSMLQSFNVAARDSPTVR